MCRTKVGAQRKLIKPVELTATGVVGGVVCGQFGTCGDSAVPYPLLELQQTTTPLSNSPCSNLVVTNFYTATRFNESVSTILFTRKINDHVYVYFDYLK